jgi:LysM repeat protein
MFAKALAILLAVPFVAQFASAQQCTRQYTVQQGDICDSISAAQNVSTYQLAVVNEGIIDVACDNLMPGETICLGFSGEDCSTTYVVDFNDTCDQVASAYGINTTTLYYNNPQLNADCTNLYVGEVVCVSSGVSVPPLPSGTMPATALPSTAYPASPSSLPWCD